MNVVVVNCFDWVAFHLVEKFINEGYHVLGVDSLQNERREFLYDMVGRNSSFHLYDSIQELKNKKTEGLYAFVPNQREVDRIYEECKLTGEQYYILSHLDQNIERKKVSSNAYHIQLPNVIGPWMSKKEFNSIKNHHDLLYIDDFITWVTEMPNMATKPNLMRIRTKSITNQDNGASLENEISVLQKVPIEESINRVENHIQKFPIYYKYY